MKKIFQKLVDRIHSVWIVLTRKNFAVFAYDKIDNEHTKGGACVISDIENERDEELFFETISDFLKKL